MRKSLLIGMPALLCASSCVPSDPPRTAAAVPATPHATGRPVVDNRMLLQRLALAVPDDLAGGPILSPLPKLPAEAAPPFNAGTLATDDAERATECLTAAIYHEARSEPLDGQRAVAQVVLNRVRDRAFPATVCGVVYQGSNRRTGCQFSFTCDGSMLRPHDVAAWARARVVAQMALSGSVYAPVGAATSYHANYVLPWWAPSLSRVAAVGSHIFYRWRSGLERALTFRQVYAGHEPDAGPALLPIGEDAATPEVAIHVGADAAEGVTIHREPAMIQHGNAVRVLTAGGVRIHRGADPHAGIGPDEDVGDLADPDSVLRTS